jgi:two-component system, NarL family, sensor kinase
MRYLLQILLYIFVLCFILISKPARAQVNLATDSTYNTIAAMPNDSIKIRRLLAYGEKYEQADIVTADKIYNEALSVSKKISNLYFEGRALIYLGILYKMHEKRDAALVYYKQAYAVGIKSENAENIGGSLANMGNIYLSNNQIEASAKANLEAIIYLEKINKPKQLSLTLGNIVVVYNMQQYYKKAIEYGLKSVAAAEKSMDGITIGRAYINLSYAYFKLGDRKKSFDLCTKALEYFRGTNLYNNLFSAYQNISSYYIEVPDINTARLYADSSLQMAMASGLNKNIAEAKILQSNIENQAKNFSKASQKLLEAKKNIVADPNWQTQGEWNKSMALLKSSDSDYKNKLQYFDKKTKYDDSLRNEDILKHSLDLETKYETEKKQAKIIELENEKKLQQIIIKQKNISTLLLAIGLIAAFIIGILFYRNVKRKQILAKQTAEIKDIQINNFEKEKQLLAVSSMLESQETERSRMAKDLHDGLGGILSGIKLNLSSIKGNLIIHESDGKLFNKSIVQIDSAIEEMRRVAHNMMPEALLKFGLVAAIEDYCEAVNENDFVKLKFTYLGANDNIEKSVEIILYRIIQELTNNAIKHAEAKNIFIQLTKHERGITLTVEDDGIGFNTAVLAKNNGAGLKNVQYRVDYLKGLLSIESALENGTSVNVEIPFENIT